MACGEFGPGRMAEPDEILAAIIDMLKPKAQPLAGKKVLITAGPTREPIDPVRFISNHSSGKQGYAIARAAVELGAETVLVSGPVVASHSAWRPDDAGRNRAGDAGGLRGRDAGRHRHLHRRRRRLARCRRSTGKAQEDGRRTPSLTLTENPDILATISAAAGARAIVVGFAAETERVTEHATQKLKKKGCDLIVANDVSKDAGVFGGDRNTVHLVSASGIEDWPQMSKDEVAEKLMERLAQHAGAAARPRNDQRRDQAAAQRRGSAAARL